MTRGELDHETRATGRLPGVDIEVVHRPAAQGRGEQISIHLTATPSLEAFGRTMEAANPFAFWAQTVQLAWMPWLEAMRMLSTPWLQVPPLSGESAPSSLASGPRSLPK